MFRKFSIAKTISFFDHFFLYYWWVILFAILCYMFYEQGLKQRDLEYDLLSEKIVELKDKKTIALEKKEELLLQINSQSDPAWIELTLKRILGLVSEGETKVYFYK